MSIMSISNIFLFIYYDHFYWLFIRMVFSLCFNSKRLLDGIFKYSVSFETTMKHAIIMICTVSFTLFTNNIQCIILLQTRRSFRIQRDCHILHIYEHIKMQTSIFIYQQPFRIHQLGLPLKNNSAHSLYW